MSWDTVICLWTLSHHYGLRWLQCKRTQSLQKAGASEGAVEASCIRTKEPSKCLGLFKLFCLFSKQQVVIYSCYVDLLPTAPIPPLKCFLATLLWARKLRNPQDVCTEGPHSHISPETLQVLPSLSLTSDLCSKGLACFSSQLFSR